MTAEETLTKGVDDFASALLVSSARRVILQVARDARVPGKIFQEPSGATAKSIEIRPGSVSVRGPVKTVEIQATTPGAFFTNLGKILTITPRAKQALSWIAGNGERAFSAGHDVDMRPTRSWLRVASAKHWPRSIKRASTRL